MFEKYSHWSFQLCQLHNNGKRIIILASYKSGHPSGSCRSGSFDVEQQSSLERTYWRVVTPRVNAVPVLTKLRRNWRRGGD